MNKLLAKAITGGLSNTSKMPGKSIGLPSKECKTGQILAKKKGSVCENCYAGEGCYVWQVVQEAQYRRLEKTPVNQYSQDWIDAMVFLVQKEKFFRWHDSGDIQSMLHLQSIVEVCKLTPNTLHWLPTKEKGIIKGYRRIHGDFPDNLVVRVSAAMIDSKPVNFENNSTVHTEHRYGAECKAYRTQKNGNLIKREVYESLNRKEKNKLDLGYCGTCRACWDKRVKTISYKMH